ncbi:redoxin domain-containing protein [Maribacter sp. 2210JD10-5]|uniref:redoxin domain-containing protein n=1 Tax=Maribacter sp. 2210JD10-5 TaxID=3386272 RepID=UPI0039BC4CDE
MKLRKLTYPILVALLLQMVSGCNDHKVEPDHFRIAGKLEGMNSGVISLVEYSGEGEELILDATTVKQNEFVLHGSLKSPKPAYLVYDDTYELPLFLEEGETVVTLHTGETQEQFLEDKYLPLVPEFQNSEINTVYQAYRKQMDSVENLKRFEPLNKLLNGLMESLEENDTLFVAELEEDVITISDEKDEITSLIRKQFAMRHNSSPIAPYIMLYEGNGLSEIDYTLEELEQLLANFDKSLSNNPYYKEFETRINTLKRLGNGKPAPEFTLRTPEGMSVSLVDFKGKYLLLDFWAAWCGPCTDNFPKIRSLEKHYEAQGFEVLGISDDPDVDIWKNAIEKYDLTWSQVIVNTDAEPGTSVSELYNIEYLPMYFLLDIDGKIIMKDYDITVLEEVLEDLFNEPDPKE